MVDLDSAADPLVVPWDGRLPRERCPLLSGYFAPFLPHFAAETVAAGGSVLAALGPDGIDGLFLRRESERIGSIFARTPDAAARLYRTRGPMAVYSEHRLDPEPETYSVLAADLPGSGPSHRFLHAVREAGPAEAAVVERLLTDVYGRADSAWLAASWSPPEHCLLAEIGGRPVGVAWVTVVGPLARFHSLSVLPRYRRIGIGTDLWHARALRARAAGASRAITEIAESNAASVAISTAGGMRRIGQVFENRS